MLNYVKAVEDHLSDPPAPDRDLQGELAAVPDPEPAGREVTARYRYPTLSKRDRSIDLRSASTELSISR